MGKIQEILSKETAGLPNWAWIAIVAAGIGATYVLPKLFGKATGTTANTPTTSSDSGTSQAGLGLAVDPTTGLPYAVEGLVPSGGLAGTTLTGTGGSQPLMTEVGLIRSRNNNEKYDKKVQGGVPIRSSPGGKEVSTEAYGGEIKITGPAVQGAWNLPGNQGSNLWYPVLYGNGQQGYISAYDFNGAPASRSGWPNS
jgi:hypothetical protein